MMDLLRIRKKIWGSFIVLSKLPLQKRMSTVSPQTLREIRDARIRKLVRYAAETVPYYRQLFRDRSINPRSILNAEDLTRIPLLSKGLVRDRPHLFVSESPLGQRSIPFLTSGSTGTPVQIRHDEESLVANIPYCETERRVIRDFLGSRQPIRQVAILVNFSTVKKIKAAYRDLSYLRPAETTEYLNMDQPVEEIIEELNHMKPDMITSYGSYVGMLFNSSVNRGLPLHAPKVVLYGSDELSGKSKAMIHEHFGTRVFSRYTAVESFRIGFTCVEDNGFHVREDLCHLEIVHGENRSLKPGQSGEIVMTNLVNRGTVLINYRIGDLGMLNTSPCRCGLHFPLLERLEGRVEDILYLPDGHWVNPRDIWGVIKNFPQVQQYQLIQIAPLEFKLRIVVREQNIPSSTLHEIRSRLGAILHQGDILIESLNEFLIEPGKKFRPVLSLPRAHLKE